MRRFEPLKNAIADLNLHYIQDELSHMTENEMAFINDWHHHVNIMIREHFSIIPPYDLVINCTIKRFLETGDISLVQQCVDILNLLKAKGWDGIVYNGIIGKVFNYEVFNEAPFERFNVSDFPNFNQKNYDAFASLLTKTLREKFATWEETSFEEYIASLEKQNQEQQAGLYPDIEHLQRQLQHVKDIATQREERKQLTDAPPEKDTKKTEPHSTLFPQEPFEQFLTENGAIDLSKLIQLPVGSTHRIYKIPGNDNILLKVVIDSMYDDANIQKNKLRDLTEGYAKLYEIFGENRCLVESRFIRKIKDPNNPESQQAILSLVKFDKCFQSEHKFGFNTESVESNEKRLKGNAAQYHAMNMVLLGNKINLPFNEEDFLKFHDSFRPIFAQLDAEPGLREAMREFLVKFKEYYDKTGNLLDLIGFDNVLFYKDENDSWQYKIGAVLKGLTREKTVQIIHEIDSNPTVVQSSFENWVPVFYMPSCLRILNATAEKVGMGKIVDDITISQQDSENLYNMYEMLSLYERVFSCTEGKDLSFEDAIYNLAQFILDNKSKKFFNENINNTQMVFGRVLEDLANKHAASLTDKLQKMISIIKALILDDTQLERAKKLSSLYELGLDVRKPFSLPEGGNFVYQRDVFAQTSEVAQQRKHYIVSKIHQEQATRKQHEITSKADEQLGDEQRVPPKKKK
jgi:hypothetical protein